MDDVAGTNVRVSTVSGGNNPRDASCTTTETAGTEIAGGNKAGTAYDAYPHTVVVEST